MEENFFRDQISSYLEDELNESELSKFVDYLNSNPAFANEVKKVKGLISNLNSIESTSTKDDFIDNLNDKIGVIESSIWTRVFKFKTTNSYVLPTLSLAAAILVVISSSYILVNQGLNMNMNLNQLANQQDDYLDDYEVAQEESNNDTTNSNFSKIRLVGGKD